MRFLVWVFFLIAPVLISPTIASAGFFELGTSYNYRQNYVNEDNKTLQTSVTGSLSYYFWEQSAIELSYTDGTSDITLEDVKVNVKFQFYGVDLVVTFADRDAVFRPYIKGGVVYQQKSTRTRYASIDKTVRTEGTSPSGGVGFRLKVTETFLLRAGVDMWATSADGSTQYDMVGRAGVSWIF